RGAGALGPRQPGTPAFDPRRGGRRGRGEADRRMAGDRRADSQPRAVERYVYEIKPERQAESFADQMTRRAGPRRRVAVFAVKKPRQEDADQFQIDGDAHEIVARLNSSFA